MLGVSTTPSAPSVRCTSQPVYMYGHVTLVHRHPRLGSRLFSHGCVFRTCARDSARSHASGAFGTGFSRLGAMPRVEKGAVAFQAVFAAFCFAMGALLSSIGRGQENGAGNIGLQLDAGTCAYTTNNTGRKTIGFEDKGSGDYDPGFLDCRFQAGRFNDAGIRETWNLRNNANGIIISGHFFAVLGWFFCIPPIIKYLGGLLLAKLGLLCAVLYGAVQAFAAHLATSARASMPPPEGRRAVIAPSPSRRPSARRGLA